MVLPIYTYGQSVLREPAPPIDPDALGFDRKTFAAFVDDMIETMHEANGIGLAAPQVGKSLRVFVVDLSPYAEEIADEHGGTAPEWAMEPLAIINPETTPVAEAEPELFEEGCLSIPDLREEVLRPDMVTLRYLNRDFEPVELIASGMLARVVQHELDHLNGVLFVDHISALRKRMVKRRLKKMAAGIVEAEYSIFPPA